MRSGQASLPAGGIRRGRTGDAWSLRPRLASASAAHDASAAVRALPSVVRALAALGLAGALAGCAIAPMQHPLDGAPRDDAMAVVPARYAPASNFAGRPLSETVAQGALAGVGAASLDSLLMLGLGAAVYAPIGVPLAFAMAPVMLGVGAIGGGLGGAAAADATVVPEEQRAGLIRTMGDIFSDPQLSRVAAEAFASYARALAPLRAEVLADAGPTSKEDVPDYRRLRDGGFGSALEVRATRIGFYGRDAQHLVLFVTAEAQVVDTRTGKPTWLRGMVYESPPRDIALWMKDGAALTRAETGHSLRTFGERIADLLVLASEPTLPGVTMSAIDSCGIPLPELSAPVVAYATPFAPRPSSAEPLPSAGTSPPYTGPRPSFDDPSMPVLAWEPVPRTWTLYGPDRWAVAKDRRYDLRIWSAVEGGPGDVVYERFGLASNLHRVETALAPAATYLWSVRMRYTLDGNARATPWSVSGVPPYGTTPFLSGARYFSQTTDDAPKRMRCGDPKQLPCACLDHIPVRNFYSFRIP
jgi:hypothetical protein